MKNLGKALLKSAKIAVSCYVGIKIGEAIVNKYKKEEPKNEEYVPFDDIQVEDEEIKVDGITKAVTIAGCVTVVTILSTLKALQAHAIYVDKSLSEAYDRDRMLLAGMIFECGKDTPADKIRALLKIKDSIVNIDMKNTIDEMIAEVK